MSQSIDELLNEVLHDISDEDFARMDQDQIMELRNKLNPYGRTIQGSDKYLNFSITMIRDEYFKKLITTAMIGYLFRMCDEWKVPEGVPVVPVDEYLDDPTKLDLPDFVKKSDNKSLIYDYNFNREWMQKRVHVFEFLEEMFQFNPDEHVRSAYRPCYGDKTRKPIDTKAGKLAVQHLKKTDKEFRKAAGAGVDSVGVDNKNLEVKANTAGVDANGVDANGVDANGVDANGVDANGVDATLSRRVREYIPPHDMFGRFTRYYTDNYEKVRDAVRDLYCEKPDFEFAINPYSWHDTADDAEAFKKKHAKEVITEVITAKSGMWNMCDKFEQVRKSTNFYTDDTIILEEIIKQNERDSKLGRDLMEKRRKIAKKKNVIEAGPHAASFEDWKKNNPHLKKLQSMCNNPSDPEIEDEDVVQVDIWKAAKGGIEFTKTKMYTQAEAPEFASEESVKKNSAQLRKNIRDRFEN